MADSIDAGSRKSEKPQLLQQVVPLPPEMTRPQERTTPNIGDNSKPTDNSAVLGWGGDILARIVGDKMSLSAANRRWSEPFTRANPGVLADLREVQRDVSRHGIALERLAGTDQQIVGVIDRQLSDLRLDARATSRAPVEWSSYKSAADAFRRDQAVHAGFMPKAVGSVLAAEVGKTVADAFLFPKQAPGGLTAAVDLFSPAIIVTQLGWRYKIGAMIGAHVLARFAEK